MSNSGRSNRKTHLTTERPPFERIALLLQGGGALGAYQAGVYQALGEANLDPDWVAGISIGAVNAALIAGNSPEHRVEKLRAFWETVSTPPVGAPYLGFDLRDRRRPTAASSIRRTPWALSSPARPAFLPRVCRRPTSTRPVRPEATQLLRHHPA